MKALFSALSWALFFSVSPVFAGQSKVFQVLKSDPRFAFQPSIDVPVVAPPRYEVSRHLEREVEEYFKKPLHRESRIDFRFALGPNANINSRGLIWRPDDDRTWRFRSKIVYRYEPKHWPTGFIELVDKAVLAPTREFISTRFDF